MKEKDYMPAPEDENRDTLFADTRKDDKYEELRKEWLNQMKVTSDDVQEIQNVANGMADWWLSKIEQIERDATKLGYDVGYDSGIAAGLMMSEKEAYVKGYMRGLSDAKGQVF